MVIVQTYLEIDRIFEGLSPVLDIWDEELGASDFVQTKNELVNGCVSGIGFYSVLIDFY